MGQCITKPAEAAADLQLKSKRKEEEKVEETTPKPAEEVTEKKVEEIKEEEVPVASGKESDRSLKRLFDKDEEQVLEETEASSGQLKRIPEEQEEQEERGLVEPEVQQVKAGAEHVGGAPETEKREAELPSTEEALQGPVEEQRGSVDDKTIKERPGTPEISESKSPSSEAAGDVSEYKSPSSEAGVEAEHVVSDKLKPDEDNSEAQKVPDLVTQDSEKFELIVKQVSEKFEIPGVPEAQSEEAENEPTNIVSEDKSDQPVDEAQKEQEGTTAQGIQAPDAGDDSKATPELASVEPPKVEAHTQVGGEQAEDQASAGVSTKELPTQDGGQTEEQKSPSVEAAGELDQAGNNEVKLEPEVKAEVASAAQEEVEPSPVEVPVDQVKSESSHVEAPVGQVTGESSPAVEAPVDQVTGESGSAAEALKGESSTVETANEEAEADSEPGSQVEAEPSSVEAYIDNDKVEEASPVEASNNKVEIKAGSDQPELEPSEAEAAANNSAGGSEQEAESLNTAEAKEEFFETSEQMADVEKPEVK